MAVRLQTPQWLSQFVMQKYTQDNPAQTQTPPQASRFEAIKDNLKDRWHLYMGTVKLQVVVLQLTHITENAELEYGTLSGHPTKNPFAKYLILDLMQKLPLDQATETFLEQLINFFKKAWDDTKFKSLFEQRRNDEQPGRSKTVQDVAKLFSQDVANSLMYLYVIPKLLLQQKNAVTLEEQALVKQKFHNVQEIAFVQITRNPYLIEFA